ncbi:MAG: alkaline phosphatase family protein [Nitrososphaeria archaeon]
MFYVVLDGLGDLPSEELEGKTPLEAAEIPEIDSLAEAGQMGLVYTVRKGVAPESDVAVISILGYDPFKYYTARGPIEAVGSDLFMKEGDVALRCNFATLGKGGRIVDRRAGRNLTTSEASKLCEAVNSKVKLTSSPAEFDFKNTVGHRAALVIRSMAGRLSGQISNTDPAYTRVEGLGVAKKDVKMLLQESRPLLNRVEAERAAQLVNEFVQKSSSVLDGHEVNFDRRRRGFLAANLVLTRDAGDSLPKLPSLNSLYGGTFGSLVEMPVERGIALLCGMREVKLPEPTGNLKHDYTVRAQIAAEAMASGIDVLYIHIKGPDEPGHDGKPDKKREIIEMIDRYFFSTLLPNVDLSEDLVVVTADHSTPCSLKAHSDDPVPLLIAGPNLKGDGLKHFSEKACRKGSLGTMNGPELMPKLMRLARD